MNATNESTPGAAEKIALGMLAALTGLVLTWVVCSILMNLIEYQSFTAPSAVQEGTNLAGGFLIPVILIFGLFSFPIFTLFFHKLFLYPNQNSVVTSRVTLQPPELSQLAWTLLADHGGGYGIYEYKGQKLFFSKKRVKWKTSTFHSPELAINSIDSYYK